MWSHWINTQSLSEGQAPGPFDLGEGLALGHHCCWGFTESLCHCDGCAASVLPLMSVLLPPVSSWSAGVEVPGDW